MSGRTYLDDEGRELFVHDGISGGQSWGTFRRKPSGSLQRVCSPALPMQPTQGKAQMDLDDRARFKGWKAVVETEPEKGVSHLPAPRTVGTEDALITDIEVDQNIREVTAVRPEFVDSIRDHGVIEPLIVTLTGPAAKKPLYLVAGHRRLLGAQEAGLERVPCQVRDLTPRQIAEFRFVENIHREDLSPLEEARAMRDLAEKHGLKQSEIARIRGKSQEWVSNRGRLLELSDPIQDLIRQGILSASAALETHRLTRYPDLAARLAIELASLTCHPDPDSPVSVAVVRDRVYWALLGAGSELNASIRALTPECEACDRHEKVFDRHICMDPVCRAKKDAARPKPSAAPAQPEPEAAEPPPVADAPPAVGYLPRPLRTCPAACPDIKGGLCGQPKSDCRKAQVLATQAVAVRELAESEERSRAEEAERAEIRARHLGRVESYLRHRIASNQKGFSHPEMRLVSLALLEGESGLDYVVAVLGGVFVECQHHASTAENYSEALLGLSTRTLTTLAVGYLLLGADGYLSDPGCALANTIAINVGLAPEPEDGVTLDAACLVNPAGAEADPQTDPEPGGDPNHDPEPGEALPIAEALGDDGEAVLETDPDSEIPGHVEEFEPASPTGTPLAALEAESKSSKAARDCRRDCKRCDQKHCDLHPSHARQAPPKPEAPEDELAPLPIAKASYGPNPMVTKCRETREPATAEECLACCSKQLWWSATETSAQGGHGLSGACCGHVTSGAAPFHCPGQLDICPTLVGGESDEGEPADARSIPVRVPPVAPVSKAARDCANNCYTCRIRSCDIHPSHGIRSHPEVEVCPRSGDPATEAQCRACCADMREAGCCQEVLAGKAPFKCPGPEDGVNDENDRPVCRQATPTPASEEETVPFVIEVGATCGPCPARDGKPVTETECRTCNEERQTSGQECCPHVISAEAPFRCPVCDKKTGCQTAAARGVE